MKGICEPRDKFLKQPVFTKIVCQKNLNNGLN